MRKIVFSLVLLLFMTPIQANLVEASTKQFTDVSNTHSNKNEIDYLVSLGVIKGYPDGSFKPSRAVTNGQAAMMVARALDLNLNGRPNPNFSDVFSTTSGFKEIAALVDEGIIPREKRFNPSSSISRESMARILTNAFNLEGEHHVNFSDVSTNYWAYSYITKLAANNITTGYLDGTFKPKRTVTRSHFAAFMARALNPAYKPVESVTRGVNFNMNMSQIEQIESANLWDKNFEGNLAKLTYNTSKFGYYTDLYYYFENGKLIFIVYDFLPDKSSYDSYYRMQALYNLLHNEAVKEFRYNFFDYVDGYYNFVTSWNKGHYQVLLSVHDDYLYTTAQLVYAPNYRRSLDQEKFLEIEKAFENKPNSERPQSSMKLISE